jgi:tripartite-type tricarboxylate transporter receptor subunit TctC
VPRGTPPEIIATLNKQTNAAVLDPNVRQRIADLGAVAVPPNSPNEFSKFIAIRGHQAAVIGARSITSLR